MAGETRLIVAGEREGGREREREGSNVLNALRQNLFFGGGPAFYLRRSHAGQWVTFGFLLLLRKIGSLEAVRGKRSMAT